MRKFLFVLALVLGLCSCGSAHDASSVMAHLLTELDGAPSSALMYYADASPDTENYLDSEHSGEIYYETFDISALCCDYAIMISNGDELYEIHILRARAHSELEEIVSALYKRRDLILQRKTAEYNPDGYEARAQSAEVYTRGNFAFLLVTGDNENAKRVIKKQIR